MPSTAEDLVLLLAREYINDTQIKRVKEIVSSEEVDWDLVFSYSIKHGVASFVYRHFNEALRGLKGQLPSDTRLKLFVRYYHVLFNSVVTYRALQQITEEFHKNNMNYLILKGILCARLVYNHWGMRPFGDIDIWIKNEQSGLAQEILQELGYKQYYVVGGRKESMPIPAAFNQFCRQNYMHTFPFKNGEFYCEYESVYNYLKESGYELSDVNDFPWLKNSLQLNRTISVELHHRLIMPSSPYNFSESTVYSRASEYEVEKNRKVRSLCLEDFFLYLCEHLYREALQKVHIMDGSELQLIRFCDIYEFWIKHQDRLSLNSLVETIREWNLEKPVFYSLFYTKLLYDTPEFDELLLKVKPSSLDFLNRFYPNNKFGPIQYTWKSSFRDRLFRYNGKEAMQIINEHYKDMVLSIPILELGDSINYSSQEIETIRIIETLAPKWHPLSTHLQLGYPPRDENDISGKIIVLWDIHNIYFNIVVRDDKIVPNRDDTTAFLYDQDAVRLLFYDVKGKSQSYFFLFLSDSRAICVKQDTFSLTTFELPFERIHEVDVNMIYNTNGYELNITFPFSLLGITPEIGTVVEFDVELHDCDNRTEGVKTILAWAGGQRNPQIRGELLLQDAVVAIGSQ